MEGSIDDLVNIIFSDNQLKDNAISFSGDFNNTKELFEALLMITTKGMTKLFGTVGTVNLENLTLLQFSNFKDKMKIIGIEPEFKKYHIYQILKLENASIDDDIKKNWNSTKNNYKNNPSSIELIKYKNIQSDNIIDYYFQIKCKFNVFIIHFKLTNKI